MKEVNKTNNIEERVRPIDFSDLFIKILDISIAKEFFFRLKI